MSEKVIGYCLITIGIIVICFASFSVFSVFTGRMSPVPLFNFDPVAVPVSSLLGEQVPQGANLGEIELFPADVLNGPTNNIAHLLLMGFLVTVGFRVASLGTNLVRPIIVKMEGRKMPSVLDPQ